MKCDEVRERMPDVAAGFSKPTTDEGKHLEGCGQCTEQLKAMRSTMGVLDEWQAPEPSQYFDVRLQARLREEMRREEMAKQARWFHWFRRPVLAAALTVLLGVGAGVFFTRKSGITNHGQEASISITAPPGTAVGDLQTLENNHEMYSDFELLDDLDLQQNVEANP